MDEEQIKKLMKELLDATYRSGSYEYHIITNNDEQPAKIESIIRKHLLDNHDKELGELRAKVYTYESIIANSNFAPLIPQKEE